MAATSRIHWGLRTLAKAGVPPTPLSLGYAVLTNWYPYGNTLRWHYIGGTPPWATDSPFNAYTTTPLGVGFFVDNTGGSVSRTVSRLCGGFDMSVTLPVIYNGPLDYVINLVVKGLDSGYVIDFYALAVATIPNNQFAILASATLLASVTAAQFNATPATPIALRFGQNIVPAASKFVLQAVLRNSATPPLLDLPILLSLGSGAPENSIYWEAGVALTPPPPGTGGIPGSAEANLPGPYPGALTSEYIALTSCTISCCHWVANVTHGHAFNYQLQLTPLIVGASPASWSATGLPSGVTLDASTGILSGTVASAGTTTVSITVTDASSAIIIATQILIVAV